MKFITFVFLAALAVAAQTLNLGSHQKESTNSSLLLTSINSHVRAKRTVGVSRDVKKEVEIKNKYGGSIKISRSVSYNDGAALTMLPAMMETRTNNRIRLLNQIQNGQGRPELAESMIKGSSSGTDTTDFGTDSTDVQSDAPAANVDTDVTSRQANISEIPAADDSNRFFPIPNNHHTTTTTTASSIDVGGGSHIETGTGSHESHISVGGGSTHVSSNGSPIIIGSPVIVSGGPTIVSSSSSSNSHVVVNSGSTGVCCSESKPIISQPVVTYPVYVKPIVANPIIAKPIVTRPIYVHPVVVTPVKPRPVVVNPIISSGVCCSQSKPVAAVPVSYVTYNTGYSHGHNKIKRHLEKSIDYHRRKQAFKEHLLNKLAAKHQHTSVVAVVPAHHVHTPNCGHQTAFVTGGHHSKLHALKELKAYKHELKAQRYRNKIAAIHAHHNKCPTCCCN